MEQWKSVEIQGLRFGEGLPKVCVPLTGQGVPALLSEMQAVSALPADLYEWRLDCFFGDPLPTSYGGAGTGRQAPAVYLRTKGREDRPAFPRRSMNSGSPPCLRRAGLGLWISSWPVGRRGSPGWCPWPSARGSGWLFPSMILRKLRLQRRSPPREEDEALGPTCRSMQ